MGTWKDLHWFICQYFSHWQYKFMCFLLNKFCIILIWVFVFILTLNFDKIFVCLSYTTLIYTAISYWYCCSFTVIINIPTCNLALFTTLSAECTTFIIHLNRHTLTIFIICMVYLNYWYNIISLLSHFICSIILN